MSTEVKVNKHQALIDGLREAAEYLHGHPDIPALSIAWLNVRVWEKTELLAAARAMGSFRKIASDEDYKIERNFGPVVLNVTISRDKVCKRTVTWDCPEDPLLGIPESAE